MSWSKMFLIIAFISFCRYQTLRPKENVNCKTPRSSPDGNRLIWLERDLPAETFPGPHGGCFRLVALDLTDEDAQPRTVVPIVKHFEFGNLHFS